ncbi:16960_t:CDS:2, partial [Racocetra fulgida]
LSISQPSHTANQPNIVSHPSSTTPPSIQQPSSTSSPNAAVKNDPANPTSSVTPTTKGHFNPTASVTLPLETNTKTADRPMSTDYPSKILTSDSSSDVPPLPWESVVKDTNIPAAIEIQIKNSVADSLGISSDDVKILSIERCDNGGVKVNFAIPTDSVDDLSTIVNDKSSSFYQNSQISSLVDAVAVNDDSDKKKDEKTVPAGTSQNTILVMGAVLGSAFLYTAATVLAVRAYRKRKARSEADMMDGR